MNKKQRKVPIRRIKASAPVSPTRLWCNEQPILDAAYAQVKSRFSTLANVCGFGLGRKFFESTNQYAPRTLTTGGLCIQIFVDKKVSLEKIPKNARIPKYITVVDQMSRTRKRVRLDVMTVSNPKLQGSTYKHDWPSAEVINVGRLFTFGTDVADRASGVFKSGEAELGTVGAIIKRSNGAYLAVSAGHVFANPCGQDLSAPQGDRRVGVEGKHWSRIPDRSFKPTRLENSGLFRDALCMAIIDKMLPRRVSWPPLFDYKLATDEDIRAAIDADDVRGFVWVDRDGAPLEGLKIDVMSGVDDFAPLICPQGRVPYGFVWPYRYLEESTVGGDSGAGVFIQAADQAAIRLLGFHFLFDADNGRGYAIDAGQFLRSTFDAEPGQNYNFA
jgi:hypothetical protein